MSADSAALSFDTRYIKADPIKEDDQPGIYRFLVENVSDKEVEFLRVNTTCSCVTATPGQNRLRPGEKTYRVKGSKEPFYTLNIICFILMLKL